MHVCVYVTMSAKIKIGRKNMDGKKNIMMKKIEIWRREKRDSGGWKKPLADEKLTPLLL